MSTRDTARLAHGDTQGAMPGALTLQSESALREALTRNPRQAKAAADLSDLLRIEGHLQEALEATAPFLANIRVDHGVLIAHAQTLKAMDRPSEALAIYQRAMTEHRGSAVALHNMAAQLGDMERFEEARVHAREALRAGLDAPQTWLVLARALLGCGELDEGRRAYREVVRRAPLDADAHRELAQLIWMTTGKASDAISVFDTTLNAKGLDPRLLQARAKALKSCGALAAAHDSIRMAVQRFPDDVALRVTAAHLATEAGVPAEGLVHAESAMRLAPGSSSAQMALCEACLGVGDASRAEAIAAEAHAKAPLDQGVLACLATAWRLLGDPRYQPLYDYDSLVSASLIDTPAGWSDLEDYLADLAQALDRAHLFQEHPFNQSLLGGSQLSNLTSSAEPAVRAFFDAVAEPIRRRLRSLGVGADPVRSRNTFGTQFHGVWSVRLRSGEGRHVDHVHPRGWLSSACYIALPSGVTSSPAREGWIKFGEPGIRTEPALQPEWFVEPAPGLLVLFPSYMWHGTAAFSGAGSRLSVAFDLLPE